MGLFSFLFDQQQPTGGGFVSEQTLPHGDPNQPIDIGVSPQHATVGVSQSINPAMAAQLPQDMGEERQLPQMQTKPGLLSRFRAPDASGASLADKIAMAGMALRDNADPADISNYRAGIAKRQLQKQQTEHRAKANAAFKAAYQNGKFDPQAYAAAMADDPNFDPAEMADLEKAYGPKTGVDGGYSYSIDHNGNTTWGDQRPLSHAEEAAQAREAEAERRNQVMEDLLRQRVGYEGQRVGIARNREGRLAHGGGGASGGVPPLPPGFVVEK